MQKNRTALFLPSICLLPIFLFITLFCLINPAASEIIEETGSLREFFMGSEPGCAYDNFVSHNIEGIARQNYNYYCPLDPQTNGFGHYEPIPVGATGDQLLTIWKTLFEHMIRGEWAEAEAWRDAILSPYPYEIVHLTEPMTSREYYMVRERLDFSFTDVNDPENPADDEIGSFYYGWGLYVFAVQPNHRRVNIQIVHPNDDFIVPYIALDMFQTIGAGSFFFSSVGREVLWTNIGTYDNTKSLCDPSRNGRHVFQMAQEAFIDYVLDELDEQPLTAQMHSYDTGNRNFSSAIVSAGRFEGLFSLPLYDWSGFLGGVINRTPWIVHPAGVIGNPNPITLTEFYGSSSARRLEVYDDMGTMHLIPNPNDLYGHPENQQFLYRAADADACSDDRWNMHVECDELPNCIDDDTTSLDFYSSSGYPVTWQNFVSITDYYRPMTLALFETLEEMRGSRHDWTITAPGHVQATRVKDNRVTLTWERARDPFFYSYRIYWDLNPDVGRHSPYEDRFSNGLDDLCSQLTEVITVDADFLYDFTYYLAMTGVDRQGNESAFSDIITIHTENTNPLWIWVVEPNGGDTWFVDSTVTVAWNPGLVGGNVKVEFSRYGMAGPWETIAESTPNDSLLSFEIDGPPSQECRVAVSSVENPAQDDTSDADFSLIISSPLLETSFETVDIDWTHSAASGWVDNWHQSTERARHGVRSYKCGHFGTGSYSNRCDSRLTHAPLARLPENARLIYYQQIQAETADSNPYYCYDGGVIEVSSDGGNFLQVTPLGGYTNVIASNTTGPLAGHACFAGNVTDWVQVNVDLSAYAGHTVQVRWRFVSDNTVVREGWYVDDISIFEALYATPGPSTVTLRREGDVLVLDWDDDIFVRYRVYSSCSPDGPFDTFEGESTESQLTLPNGADANQRFYMVYGEHGELSD
ncbi:immune inhibitor A [bacterium]|nr:immune inhibitor A [bacterium]